MKSVTVDPDSPPRPLRRRHHLGASSTRPPRSTAWPCRAGSSATPASAGSRSAGAWAGSPAWPGSPPTTWSGPRWSPPTAASLHASADENADLLWALRGRGRQLRRGHRVRVRPPPGRAARARRVVPVRARPGCGGLPLRPRLRARPARRVRRRSSPRSAPRRRRSSRPSSTSPRPSRWPWSASATPRPTPPSSLPSPRRSPRPSRWSRRCPTSPSSRCSTSRRRGGMPAYEKAVYSGGAHRRRHRRHPRAPGPQAVPAVVRPDLRAGRRLRAGGRGRDRVRWQPGHPLRGQHLRGHPVTGPRRLRRRAVLGPGRSGRRWCRTPPASAAT